DHRACRAVERLLAAHLRAPVQSARHTERHASLREEFLVGDDVSPAGRPATSGREGPLVPGYEPFLLCDFHVHTQWSDGRLTLRDVIDLYGRTGRFDVIAITDHILMKRDLLARAGRIATLGQRAFGVREEAFNDYLAEIQYEAARARREYDLLVIPGAEVTQN